jgi:hypothetical protein
MSSTKKTVCFIIAVLALFVAALGIRMAPSTDFWRIYVLRDPILGAPSELDLGNQERGQVAEARFTLANKGSGKLVLTEFESSCGCQIVERPEKDKFVRVDVLEILPGQEADLVLRLAVGGRVGAALRHSIAFRSNDPSQPEVRIPVVVPRVLGG